MFSITVRKTVPKPITYDLDKNQKQKIDAVLKKMFAQHQKTAQRLGPEVSRPLGQASIKSYLERKQ